MKIRNIIIICILVNLHACKTYQDTPNNLSDIVLSIDMNFSKLKNDGFYNTLETSKSYNEVNITNRPIIFLKSNRIFCNTSNRTDSMHFTSYFCNLIGVKFNYLFGEYIIVGDSIFAYAPLEMHIRGRIIKPFNANFSGYILNKDTILNWRMVKPYPDVNPKWNYGLVNDTTPRTLYFIKNDAVKCLDSLLKQ